MTTKGKISMKRISIATSAALLGLVLAGNGFAQGRHDQMPHGGTKAEKTMPSPNASQGDGTEQSIALKDGGAIVFRKGGTTYHTDAAGKRVRMKDGRVMEGKDGARYIMKSDAIWKQVSERDGMPPVRP